QASRGRSPRNVGGGDRGGKADASRDRRQPPNPYQLFQPSTDARTARIRPGNPDVLRRRFISRLTIVWTFRASSAAPCLAALELPYIAHALNDAGGSAVRHVACFAVHQTRHAAR